MGFKRKSAFPTFRARKATKLREIGPFEIFSCSPDPGLSFGGFYSPVAPILAAWHGFVDRAWGAVKWWRCFVL